MSWDSRDWNATSNNPIKTFNLYDNSTLNPILVSWPVQVSICNGYLSWKHPKGGGYRSSCRPFKSCESIKEKAHYRLLFQPLSPFSLDTLYHGCKCSYLYCPLPSLTVRSHCHGNRNTSSMSKWPAPVAPTLSNAPWASSKVTRTTTMTKQDINTVIRCQQDWYRFGKARSRCRNWTCSWYCPRSYQEDWQEGQRGVENILHITAWL